MKTMPEDRHGKTIFIIPGFRHHPKHKAYKAIAKILKSEGYLTVSVTIPWKQTTISQNTQYFLKEYKKIKTKKKYILGFSFGAMIAFLASTKVEVYGLILCSLSPYFKEDLPSSNFHCAQVAKQTKAKQILMLYGEKEAKPLIKRVNQAFYQIPSPHKYLVSIKKTEHNIGDKRYLHTIHQAAKVLN